MGFIYEFVLNNTKEMKQMATKEKHKQQLIETFIEYFCGYGSYKKSIRNRLNKLSYRKIKRLCKIVDLYNKYYDNTPSEADYYTNY